MTVGNININKTYLSGNFLLTLSIIKKKQRLFGCLEIKMYVKKQQQAV